VQVRHDEGVANHIGPEPCVVARKGKDEASVGERIGQPLSRERSRPRDADAFSEAEGNTDGGVIASIRTARRGRRPWHVRTRLAREPGDPTSDRWLHARKVHIGTARMPKPMMHGCGKSDLTIVAAKPANEAERSAAELVERRAGAKGNASQQSTGRAQNRASRVTGAGAHAASIKYLMPSHTRGGSRMPESGTYGSVRGALRNERPYRDLRGASQ
jgi:hypothetical protein